MISELTTIDSFFNAVVVPNRESHRSSSASLLTVYNYANSLWSLRDWAFSRHKQNCEEYFKMTRRPNAHPSDLDEPLIRECPAWSQLSMVANGLKHVVLQRPKEGHLQDASDMKVLHKSFGEERFGVGRFGGLSFIIATAQADLDFDDISEQVFQFWTTAIPALSQPRQ